MLEPDGPQDVGLGSEDLAAVVRNLEAYSRGTAHAVPPELVSRVLAAVAREAPPTPPVSFARAVAAFAPRDAARAFAGMLALVDGRRRARPALRLRAAAMVIATCLVVGSAAAGATFGGAQLVNEWFAPQASSSTGPTDLVSPTPDHPAHDTTHAPSRAAHPSPPPGASGGPRDTAEPSEPTETAEPSEKDDGGASDGPEDGPTASDGGGDGGGGRGPGPTQDH